MARRFIGLNQDPSISELERREVNRYVLAVMDHNLHLAHIRWLTLCRIRGHKVRQS